MDDPRHGLSTERNRDLVGRAYEPWVRRVVLLVLAAFCALSLANVLGQRATTTTAAGPGARLTVGAPSTLRGGLLYQARLTIVATRRIARLRVVLDEGWLQGVTTNTVIPEAADQDDADGRLVLAYGELPAGDAMTIRLQQQVNPTALGRRSQGVEVRDGDVPLVRAHRTVTFFP
jgi:hypothetical protein